MTEEAPTSGFPSYPTQPPSQPPGGWPAAGRAGPHGPTVPYANWGLRVVASILDGLASFAVVVVPLVIGIVILATTVSTRTDASGYSTSEVSSTPALIIAIVVMVLGVLIAFAFSIWNVVFRQGRIGQTIGKQVVGIQVVRLDNGQFLGTGTAFLRWLMAYLLGNLCFLNYLWPLWDAQKQTWHDKVVGSVVLAK